jgi:predicted RNase H-like nuclease (RuvC/YqgF family)
MTDLAIKKLEAENKTLKAKNNEYAKRICQQEDKISQQEDKMSEQKITIEHLVTSENELLGDLVTLEILIPELDKEIDQLLKIVAPKYFLNFVDEKELSTIED